MLNDFKLRRKYCLEFKAQDQESAVVSFHTLPGRADKPLIFSAFNHNFVVKDTQAPSLYQLVGWSIFIPIPPNVLT